MAYGLGLMTSVEYGTRQDFPGIKRAAEFFGALIRDEAAQSVLEIGAGANPTLVPDAGVRYVVNDVDEGELRKAGPGYATLLGDASAPDWDPGEQFDFIFSRMVNEHVANGATYYGNIFRALRPGGVTVHCFSTLYAVPFVVNRILPERFSHLLLEKTKPRDEEAHGKFKAYYAVEPRSHGAQHRPFRISGLRGGALQRLLRPRLLRPAPRRGCRGRRRPSLAGWRSTRTRTSRRTRWCSCAAPRSATRFRAPSPARCRCRATGRLATRRRRA